MSTDYNDINMVLKILNHIVRASVHICNASFQTGIFPDTMTIAKVVPLFKYGERHVFTNYRPISLLPQFSNNCLEKLYNEIMDTFLNKYDIFSPGQYGFISNMSTSQTLFRVGRINYKVHWLGIRIIMLIYLALVSMALYQTCLPVKHFLGLVE